VSECACDFIVQNLDRDEDVIRFELKLRKCPVCETAPELLKAAEAAFHLCESLLAVREGATDDLIRGIRDACRSAIEKAERTS
jgi:hypothetical protein